MENKRTVWITVYSPDVGMYYIGGSNDVDVANRAREMADAIRYRKLAQKVKALEAK